VVEGQELLGEHGVHDPDATEQHRDEDEAEQANFKCLPHT
jgi:hypothetical protein